MRVAAEMKVKEVLELNARMIEPFVWLAPEFERLRIPAPRKAMAGRVSIEQAARVAQNPPAEALYLLNLAAGEKEERLVVEL